MCLSSGASQPTSFFQSKRRWRAQEKHARRPRRTALACSLSRERSQVTRPIRDTQTDDRRQTTQQKGETRAPRLVSRERENTRERRKSRCENKEATPRASRRGARSRRRRRRGARHTARRSPRASRTFSIDSCPTQAYQRTNEQVLGCETLGGGLSLFRDQLWGGCVGPYSCITSGCALMIACLSFGYGGVLRLEVRTVRASKGPRDARHSESRTPRALSVRFPRRELSPIYIRKRRLSTSSRPDPARVAARRSSCHRLTEGRRDSCSSTAAERTLSSKSTTSRARRDPSAQSPKPTHTHTHLCGFFFFYSSLHLSISLSRSRRERL